MSTSDLQRPLFRRSHTRANESRFSAESPGADGVMVRERGEGRSRLMTSKPAFSDPDQQLNIYVSHVRLYPLMQHVVTGQFLFFPHFLFPA